MIQAVVFDMDGVLVDSEPVWEEVRRHVVASRGGRWDDDTQDRMMGMSTGEWSRYLSEDQGVKLTPEETAATVISAMAERYSRELPLLPGAVEAVTRLSQRWTLGLASSSPRTLIDTVLAAAGIADLFTATLSTEEVPRGKPAPDGYLTVAKRLDVDPGNCVAVEDSSNGLRSAAAAGYAAVIAVPHAKYPPAPDALDKARLVLGGLDELTTEAVAALG
jgi:HAD superfamily hydrolase (TIGR01509 family)